MREFFVLSHDDRDDLEVVSDYEMDDFDLTVFWSGRPFNGDIPSAVRLWVSKGGPADLLGNPLSWQIVSNRLWAMAQPLVQRDCQHVPVPLYYEGCERPVPGYLLLNTTRCLPAVSKAESGADVSIMNLILDTSQIPLNVHIFRLAESSTVIIVSDAIVDAVRGKEMQGIAFLRTKTA